MIQWNTQVPGAGKSDLRRDILVVGMLLTAASLAIFPFVYRGTFGEADTMRMGIGICKSIVTDTDFHGYNGDISFGYYQLLETAAPLIKNNRGSMLPIMNDINAVAAVLFTIPFFFTLRRYWGEPVAVMACLTLLFVPVWWNTALYGHPMIPSILFFFCGIFVLVGRSASPTSGPPGVVSARGIGAAVLFALALSFRLDAVLIFPLIPVVLWLEGQRPWPALLRSVVWVALALILVFSAKALLGPSIPGKESNVSALAESLAHWHSPSRLLKNVVGGTSIAMFAWHPLFVLLGAASAVYMIRKRQFKSLVFVGMIVLVNYLFWMANPSPARHYVYAAPFVAVAVAILMAFLADRLGWRSKAAMVLFPVGLGLVSLVVAEGFLPVAQKTYPWKYGVQNHSYRVPIRSMVINKFHSQRSFLNGAELGRELLTLPAKEKTILVISDYPHAVGLEMALRSDIAARTFTLASNDLGRVYTVRTEANSFVMPDVFSVPASTLLSGDGIDREYLIMIDAKSMVGRSIQNDR